MKRFTKFLTLGLISVGLLAAGCRRHHCGWGPHKMTEKFANKAVSRISSKLDLDDNQRAKVEKIKHELLAKADTFRTMRKEVHGEVLAQSKSDKVDEAKLNKLFDERQSDMLAMRKLLISKYAEFHSILNAEQRKELVEMLEKHHKRCKG